MSKLDKHQEVKYKRGITFGVFDMFHIGHLNLLRNAKELCDELIVCVSSDAYCLKYKGVNPTIPGLDRLEIIEAIEYVDEVDVQCIKKPKQYTVDEYKPDVIFVGDDWKGKDWDGARLGIPVVYLPYTREISSTILRKQLK